MTFNTKLNIGDTVWHIGTGSFRVRETTITGVTIVHKPTDYCQGECETKIVYESSDNCNLAEENEGKYWWATRKGIIDYLTKTLKSVGNGKKSNPIAAPRSLNEEFEEFFNDDLPKPPTRSSNRDLQKVFEDAFGPKAPAPQEKFKIVIPPDLYRRMQKVSKKIFQRTSPVSKITEGMGKKTVKGTMGGKEFVGRFKKLPGIREKTLTDYADEL